ncbi:MAG: hypothetical protein LPK88_11455 [Alphaproteobacteria bacterium]|mgnify:CR=1 FL=1|nr:hypothetical protein [Alphaproteobacteria bacterium]MDX5416914.1 hypothetical protein [Alphaproteobacteria bacterium]MDX5494312.1 hypothetical protein [Alphaproteobacteria bacterium]
MSGDEKKDQKRGDEILRRLLKTPPQPKKGEGDAKAPPSLSDKKRKNRGKAK